LTISRETFGNINTLEYLSLSDCPNMEVLPPQVTQQPLEKLHLFGASLKELPGAIGDLSNLELLELGSPFLETLPPSFGYLRSLQKLGLYNCQELKYLPDSVGLLSKLTTLHIEYCGICYLPSDVMKMNNLESLQIVDCPLQELPFSRALTKLDSIDKCMFQLKFLQLYNTRISEVSFHEGVCPNLQYLKITSCDDLVEVGALPTSLITLDLSSCRALRRIRGICGLAKLQILNINGCKEVEELSSLETLISLEDFRSDIYYKVTKAYRVGIVDKAEG
jgi:Leucine-rich repeat (LRR) protein